MYFHFSDLYLSLAGNIIVYTPDQGTNREKYFNHIIYQRKGFPLWRELNTFPSISSLTDRVFHLSTEKGTVRSVGNGHQSGYSRADTINININKDQSHFHSGKKFNNTAEK